MSVAASKMTRVISLHSKSHIKLCVISDRQVLLCATHSDEFYFTGVLDVKTLLGSVEIMGFKLTSKDSGVTAYSSKENCVLKISMLEESDRGAVAKTALFEDPDQGAVIASTLQALKISENVMHNVISNPSVSHLVLLTKNEDCYDLLSVLKYYNMPAFHKENIDGSVAHSLQMDVTNYQKYQEHVEWCYIFNKLAKKKCSKTVICGGKGVGKSTFLKFLLNRSLERWREVIVLDFDPGQPEFTLMGCLSVVLVTKPVIGPNFTHLLTPERCLFFGDISVSSSPDVYIQCVKSLINYCTNNFNQVPWFINTMGFTEDLGMKLLCGILTNIRPTDVIQIDGRKQKDNFPQQLLPEFWRIRGFTNEKFPKYELHSLPSVAETNTVSFDVASWGLNSATKRNIVTLSYFSKVAQFDGNLLNSIPQKLSFSDIKILIDKHSSQFMHTELTTAEKLCCINANMVALCYGEAIDDLIECVGFGVIRGFDENAEELYIMTPMSYSQFQHVNIIYMSSSIQLPDIVYQKQAYLAGSHVIPYLMNVPKDTLCQKIKKSSSRIKYRV